MFFYVFDVPGEHTGKQREKMKMNLFMVCANEFQHSHPNVSHADKPRILLMGKCSKKCIRQQWNENTVRKRIEKWSPTIPNNEHFSLSNIITWISIWFESSPNTTTNILVFIFFW